jgi:hypothetical protein
MEIGKTLVPEGNYLRDLERNRWKIAENQSFSVWFYRSLTTTRDRTACALICLGTRLR